MGLIQVNEPAPTSDDSTMASLRSVVKSMDGLLDVKWMPIAAWNAHQQRWEGRYALTCDWPQADARWSMIQSGEMDPKLAFDLIGWMCEDMQKADSIPLGPELIEQKVVALLGTMDNTRYPWKQRFLSTIEKNRKNKETQKADMLDMVHDEASYQYRAAKGIPQITGADFNSEGKLIS